MSPTLAPIRATPKQILADLMEYKLVIRDSDLNSSPCFETALTIEIDSRLSGPMVALIAIKGVAFDAHKVVHGCSADFVGLAIVENADQLPQSVPYILVTSTRAAWAVICAAFFGHPERRLKLIAITGTNGKTSTVWYIRELLQLSGRNCATIGTLGFACGDQISPSSHTTPDPPEFFGNLASCVNEGIEFVAMEASSHALAQQKLFPCRFEAAGFTSFSRDHLDFHGSMENYFATKMLLFNTLLSEQGSAVVHFSLRDAFLNAYRNRVKSLFYAYDNPDLIGDFQDCVKIEKSGKSEVRSSGVTIHFGEEFFLGTVGLYGEHALENFCCAVMTAALASGEKPCPSHWPMVRAVPGRLELVTLGKSSSLAPDPLVFVDYAHSPDALEKVLIQTRSLLSNGGQLLLVFGCGGERDRGKRPLMGAIAERLADFVLITSDNPRTEQPMAIIAEIQAGFQNPNTKSLMIEPDRRKAIDFAISKAGSFDIVLIAGKGHEPYQEILNVRHPFDDREVARSMLQCKQQF